MKIFVTGSDGRVGRRLLKLGCFPLIADVTQYREVKDVIESVRPDVVIHLASMSDVNQCELPENKEKVIRVNYGGTANVAEACHAVKCGMVMLSTDHIFDGRHGPYKEDYPYYRPNLLGQYQKPVNYYGLSKLTAEGIQKVFPMKIVRTSYLFDNQRDNQMRETWPTFLLRSFMYVGHFAEVLKQYADRFFEMPDILNISGSSTVSWYEFALAMASVYGYRKDIFVPRTKELKDKSLASRPHKAGLNTSLSRKLGFTQYTYLAGLQQMKKDLDAKS